MGRNWQPLWRLPLIQWWPWALLELCLLLIFLEMVFPKDSNMWIEAINVASILKRWYIAWDIRHILGIKSPPISPWEFHIFNIRNLNWDSRLLKIIIAKGLHQIASSLACYYMCELIRGQILWNFAREMWWIIVLRYWSMQCGNYATNENRWSSNIYNLFALRKA